MNDRQPLSDTELDALLESADSVLHAFWERTLTPVHLLPLPAGARTTEASDVETHVQVGDTLYPTGEGGPLQEPFREAEQRLVEVLRLGSRGVFHCMVTGLQRLKSLQVRLGSNDISRRRALVLLETVVKEISKAQQENEREMNSPGLEEALERAEESLAALRGMVERLFDGDGAWDYSLR